MTPAKGWNRRNWSKRPGQHIRALVCGFPRDVRRNRWITVAQGFIDDSGSEPSKPIFVLAGFLSDVERWERFSDKWQERLHERPSIAYFKMQEANSLKGQFLRWKERDRNLKVRQLIQIIRHHVAMRVSCSMEWNDYRDILKGRVRPHANDRPYFFLFYRIIANVIGFQMENNIPEPVDFVFDQQGKIGKRALLWYDWILKNRSPQLRPYFGDPPIFRHDDKVLPLQAADTLAWQIRRQISDDRNNPNEDHSVLESLLAIRGRHQPLTRKYLQWLKTMAGSGLASALQARFREIGEKQLGKLKGNEAGQG